MVLVNFVIKLGYECLWVRGTSRLEYGTNENVRSGHC